MKSLFKCEKLGDDIPLSCEGRIVRLQGQMIVSSLPHCFVGEEVRWRTTPGSINGGQIVSFNREEALIAPYEGIEGLRPGLTIQTTGKAVHCRADDGILGKVVNAFGDEFFECSETTTSKYEIMGTAPSCVERKVFTHEFETGVKSVDLFLPMAEGQRMGLFAPPGVGKSTLLGMLARNAKAEVNVIALIGERGREIAEFISDAVPSEIREKTVIVASTSDESPIVRKIAAYTATTIAEYFRNRGKKVLFLMDSLTRVARAMRDLHLACGELPVRHGFPPGVYAELPKLIERIGATDKGAITAIYTVLTNAELDIDPLSEEIKSLLDGHIQLSSQVASRGIRPAIDVLHSVSRAGSVDLKGEKRSHKELLLKLLTRLRNDKELLLLGGIPDNELSIALKYERSIYELLHQSLEDNPIPMSTIRARACSLASEIALEFKT